MCGSSVAPLLSFHSRCASNSSSALALRRSSDISLFLDLPGLCRWAFLSARFVFGKVAVAADGKEADLVFAYVTFGYSSLT